ncbi:NB-ARC domain-containing protein [Catenulispora yoronensis]
MSEAPDPSRVTDLAELIALLGELRTWAGSPSYRLLAKQVGRLMRPAQDVSVSTVVDVFKTSRRRLNADLLVAVVRALELDEEDVERWREAYLRTQRATRADAPTGVLRQLPADLATFTGREYELAALLASVDAVPSSSQTVIVSAIEGMAGVGKTQLAVHAAHELMRSGRYCDVQLYVNLRGFDPEREPAEPAEVLGTFLRQLAVPAREIPDSREERSAMFRDRLHGRQTLVLLDNAANEEQVRDLIPADRGSLVLITSRRRLAAWTAPRWWSSTSSATPRRRGCSRRSPARIGSAPNPRPPRRSLRSAAACRWPSRSPPRASAPAPPGAWPTWPANSAPARATPSAAAPARRGRSSTSPTPACTPTRSAPSACWPGIRAATCRPSRSRR